MTDFRLTKIKKGKSNRGIKLLLSHFGQQKRELLFVFLVLFVSTVSGLFVPMVAKTAIDENFSTGSPEVNRLLIE